MCGGAIISDYIPGTRSRRPTADYLWPDLKQSAKATKKSRVVNVDDDFEADFQHFKDYSDEEEEEEDVKPFVAFPKPPSFSRGWLVTSCYFILFIYLFGFLVMGFCSCHGFMGKV